MSASGDRTIDSAVEAARAERKSAETKALRTLARSINASARYAADVSIRKESARFIVTKAAYRAAGDPLPAAEARVELLSGAHRVGVIYDATGWEVQA